MTPLSDIEKLERLLRAAYPNLSVSLVADWKAMRGEIERLESLVYVPGLWRCPKCQLNLVSNTLHAGPGLVSANNNPQQCVNGCGPMWRVTERDAGNDLIDRAEKHRAEIERLTKERDRAYEICGISKGA